MDYRYMIVSFLEDKQVGAILEPPKNPHITIKKKFKLIDISEHDLINLLESNQYIKGHRVLELGETKDYGNDENKVIEVLNDKLWHNFHRQIQAVLRDHIKSRDPHFENDNYMPHVTWKLKGEQNLDPNSLVNKTLEISKIYLIERIHPTISRAKILAKINL